MSNIDIRNLTGIGITDIDVYETAKEDYIITGELDYVCVNDAYQHKKGTTYYDLDNKGIILNDNCKPYAFVGTLSPDFKGRLAIIENIETGQLFYPKRSSTANEEKHGYMGYNSYNEFVVEFKDFRFSMANGVKVYANRDGEYFVNERSIGVFQNCRECAGLLKVVKNENFFTINKKTFTLPDKFSVVASDINEITKKMEVIIKNDRRKNRDDKEDQTTGVDSVPLNEEAGQIFKEIATLWNNYESLVYIEYLSSLPGSEIAFNILMSKLDNEKLLMPELIQNGKLPNISESFIQTFFKDKIKGFANAPVGLVSFYVNIDDNVKSSYQQAGSDLVDNFYNKTGDDYYKTKIIADAIYKTETGKSSIENMIKLVDHIFQYQFNKNAKEMKANRFLKKPLDEHWFKEGIDVETFPAFGVSSLFSSNEDKLALFCIGGTQGATVAVKDFKPIVTKNQIGYNATIVLQYLDTFGVSESDFTKDLGTAGNAKLARYNYRGGVMGQWILQHQYGYKPFNDYLTYVIEMEKMWKK